MTTITTLRDQLYDETITDVRPQGTRLGAMGKTALTWAGEKILKMLPNSPNFFFGFYNLYKNAAIRRLSIEKHKNGQIMGNIRGIPLVGNFFQNLWSMGHLAYHGFTDIGAIYTVKKAGQEYAIGLQGESSPVINTAMGNVANIGQLTLIANNLDLTNKYGESDARLRHPETIKGYGNAESVNAGAHMEMTDFDIGKAEEYENFAIKFEAGEYKFIKGKGKATVVGTTPAGDQIIKYERPSRFDMLKFYAKMDFRYTLYDSLIGAGEKALPALAGLRQYEQEVDAVIHNTLRSYGIAA